MCSITAHDKLKPTYVDDASIGGDKATPKNATTVALESLVATLQFIDCRLKLFHNNYEVRSKIYNEYIYIYEQIPTMKSKPLSHY